MPETDAGWGFPNPATPPGSSVYYAVRFEEPERRDRLAALFGWRQQVRDILVRVPDPGVARAKLRWWREELERLRVGSPNHPLTQRLAPAVERLGLPIKPLLEMTLAVESELGGNPGRDFEALARSAELDLGALFELLVRAGGNPAPECIARARRLGAYASLVGGIRDSGLSIRHGRLGFASADLLDELKVRPQDLAMPAARAHLPLVLAELAGRLPALRGDESQLTDLPAAVRIQVRLADRLLAKMARLGFQVADRRVELVPIVKLWHAWRELRR